MRERILVSVIISSYNHEKYVGKAIESILHQTYQNFELLIVDDGSTDESVKIISDYNDSRIVFARFEENTALAACERIMASAKGTYIAWLGSDDMWEPELLEKYINFLEEHEEYGCCFCVPNLIDENDNPITDAEMENRFNKANQTKEQWFRLLYKQGNCICAPSMCMRKKLFEKVAPFRFEYRQVQDYELWLRLLQIANIYVYPEKLVKYRVSKQKDNMSAWTLETGFRYDMEMKYISYDIMENLEDDFFIKAFNDELILRPEDEGFCVECEKYSVMLDSPVVHPDSNIFYFFKHYKDKKFRNCMEKYYHVSRNDFWKYTGTDFDNVEMTLQNIEMIKKMSDVIEQLEGLLAEKDRKLKEIMEGKE